MLFLQMRSTSLGPLVYRLYDSDTMLSCKWTHELSRLEMPYFHSAIHTSIVQQIPIASLELLPDTHPELFI